MGEGERRCRLPSCRRRAVRTLPAPRGRAEGEVRTVVPARDPASDAERMELAVRAGDRAAAPHRRTRGWAASSPTRTARSSGRASTSGPGAPHAEANALTRGRGARPGRHRLRHARAVRAPRPHAAVRRRADRRRDRPCRRRGRGSGSQRLGSRPRPPAGGRDRGRGGRGPARPPRTRSPRTCATAVTVAPFAVLKSATSLDGRTAAADGSSQWITGEAARADAHRLRAESQAVVVGAGTALADRPTLTVRGRSPSEQPAVAGPARTRPDESRRRARSSTPSSRPRSCVTTDAAPSAVVDAWRSAGAKVVDRAARGAGDRRSISRSVLAVLGAHQVLQALVEGGPTLHTAFVRAGLADRLVTYVGGVTLGAGRAADARRPPSPRPSPKHLAGGSAT